MKNENIMKKPIIVNVSPKENAIPKAPFSGTQKKENPAKSSKDKME